MAAMSRHRHLAVALLALVFAGLPVHIYAAAPVLLAPDWTLAGVAFPATVDAFAVILVDVETRTVLYERNADLAIPPASLTKLVAIQAALEAVDSGEVSLDESFAPPEEAWAESQPTGSSLMFLGEGQRVTIRDLLYGLGVSSGNDAAVALALRIDGSVAAYADRMNRLVADMGLERLHFVEPSGLSSQNTITARELARFLIVHIESHPELLEEVYSTLEFTYPQEWNRTEPSARTPITQRNRNGLLLSYPGTDGLKTGYIDVSGYHIAATAVRGGRRLLALVLGVNADDHLQGAALREAAATALLDYGFDEFSQISMSYPQPDAIPVYRGDVRSVVPRGPGVITMTVPAGAVDRLDGEYEGVSALVAPVDAESEVGRITISLDGQVLRQVPLVIGTVGEGNWVRRAWDSIRMAFRSLGHAAPAVDGSTLHPAEE